MSNVFRMQIYVRRRGWQKCGSAKAVFLSIAMLILTSINGLSQQLSLSASTLTFTSQTVGTNGSPQTVFLTSTASSPISVTIAVTGDFNGDFSQTNTCPSSLPAGGSCAIAVTFAPHGTGPRTAAITVVDSAGDPPQSVALAGTGQGLCSDIGDCAYPLLQQRVTANQAAFFVYRDADSAYNHGFPSGFFGSTDVNQAAVVIDAACVDSLASSTGCSTDPNAFDATRGTVFRLSFPPLTGEDFFGISFQEPEHYSPGDGSNAYNLSPATAIQFDVRSPDGAVVQFGVGGCVTGFFPALPSWTTITLPLESFYPPPGGSASPCPPDVTNTHILFSVGATAETGGGGKTVLLDNVQFIPVPARQTSDPQALSLPLSNTTYGIVPVEPTTFGQFIPTDQSARNVAATYESALTILSLLDRGQPADVADALEIADALDYALHHDNHGDPVPPAPDGSVGLHDAYMTGDIANLNGQATGTLPGDVRLAGFSVTTAVCGAAKFCLTQDGETGGNNAWAILALAAAYLQSGNVTYLVDAESIGDWIIGKLQDPVPYPTSYGGYLVGFNQGGTQQPNLGKSTENNGDIFGAFTFLAQINNALGNSAAAQKWTTAANVAGDFVMRMYDPVNGRFFTGTVTRTAAMSPAAGNCPDPDQLTWKTVDVPNVCEFLDSNTFTALPMAGAPRYSGQIDWAQPIQHIFNYSGADGTYTQTVTAGGVPFQGFDLVPATPNTGVTFEFTGQMAETCQYIDSLLGITTFENCGPSYVAQILNAQNNGPFGDGAGLVASILQNGNSLPIIQQCVATPFQCIAERVGLAATNWAIISTRNFNPMAFAAVGFSPNTLSFSNQQVGTTSQPQQTVVTNTGVVPLNISSVAVTGDFTLINSTCNTGAALSPGGSCLVTVAFAPTAAGTRTGTLVIADSGLGSPQSAGLTGSGTPVDDFSITINPVSQALVAGSSAAFSINTATSAGIQQNITLSVAGLPTGAVATFLTNPITSGSPSTMIVTSSPATPPGSYTITVTGTTSEVTHATGAALSIASPLAFTHASLAFGTQAINTPSTPQSLTLINDNGMPLPVKVVFTGVFAGDFSETDTCGSSLAPQASCFVNVVFTPTGTGPRPASMLAVTGNADNSYTVALTGTGLASCASISECGYNLLNERVSENRNAFFVYQDADSGFNHGFPSGLFGNIDLTSVVLDAACIDSISSSTGCSADPNGFDATRGTVFRITFPPLSSAEYAGLNFVEPQAYSSGDGSIGYDLTPASSVQFNVRSPTATTVQFGSGGCITPFYTLTPTWTTITFSISSLASPSYPPATCPPDITSTHLLFTVTTNGTSAPQGGTVLIDNVQILPVPTRQAVALTLPVSTQTFGIVPQANYPIPPDQVNRNLSTLYESSLTALALVKRGQPGDVTNALEIANAFDYALHHDNAGDPIPPALDGSVGLHSSYESGDLALLNNQAPQGAGLAGQVRLSGFSAGTALCGANAFCLVLDGATGGNNAWAILALATTYLYSGNIVYLNDAEEIGDWIASTLADTSSPSYGGYFIGWSDGGKQKSLLLGKSTEHNADIFAAFSLLAQIENSRGNAETANQWTARANAGGDFVMSMFDPVHGRFYTGTLDGTFTTSPGPGVCPNLSQQKGTDVINTCDFLDADSASVLAMAGAPRYATQIDWRLPLQYVLASMSGQSFVQNVIAAGSTYQGLTLVPAPAATGIAWEFTAQAVVSMEILDALYPSAPFSNSVGLYLNQIQQAQGSAPFGDGQGLTASTLQNGDQTPASQQCLVTPYECIPERVGLAATTWSIFADQTFNPMSGSPGWQQVPGSLQEISTGADGTIWGINSAQQIFFFNAATQTWTAINGSLTQISVGANGYVWGLNAGGQIYRWDPDLQKWDYIPGNLSQLAVGADGDVWGINQQDHIYHFDTAAQHWDEIAGSLTQIAVGFDGAVWGINAGHRAYRFNPGTHSFEQVTNTALSQIAVGADGDTWGLDGGTIYHFDRLTQSWDALPGNLAEITVGSGANVWGLDAFGDIFRFNAGTQNWDTVAGNLIHISAGADGAVWGVNSEAQIYRYIQATRASQTLHEIPGMLIEISAAADGNAWGVDSAGGIWTFDPLPQSWTQIPGSLAHVAVGFGGNVWGVNAFDQIWHYDPSIQNWTWVSGSLAKIAVGANGDVWGLNSAGQIYRFDGNQGWDNIPGALAQISVGADGAVWGINGGNQIYRFDARRNGWDYIPGALTQISVGSTGNVWGLNAAGSIYRYDSQNQTWDQIPGNLTYISVAFDGAAWGVNGGGQIWRYDSSTHSWDYIPGALSRVSVGSQAVIWGINSSGQIFKYQ